MLLSDHEKFNGSAADDNIRPIVGLPEDDPEYVRDLLTRLREEMEGIHKEEEEASRRGRSVSGSDTEAEPAEDDIPPFDLEDPTPEVASVIAEEETTEDTAPPFDLEDPVPEAAPVPSPIGEESKVAADAPEAPQKAVPKTAPRPPQTAPAPAWEELTMNALIDDLIAEKRSASTAPSEKTPTRRAEAVTEELLAPTVEELPKAAPAPISPVAEVVATPVVEEAPAPMAEKTSSPVEKTAAPEAEEAAAPIVKEAPAVSVERMFVPPMAAETPAEPPKAPQKPTYDGIWAVAAAANAPVKKRKVYRARLVRREGIFFGAAPRETDLFPQAPMEEPTAAPYCEPAVEQETIDPIGTLRPQDFFIADLREENEISSLDKADEYVSRNQIESILNAYASEKKQVSLRFILAVILSSFLLVFENLPLLGIDYQALLGIGARGCVLVSMGLLLAISLLATDRFRDGALELFAWELGVSAITLISVVLSLVFSVIVLIFDEQILLSLPAALAVTLSLYFYRMQVSDDERTFLLLCESGDKLAAESIPAFCATEEIAVLGRRIREVVRIKKVGFVTGYFARTKQKREDYQLHTVLTLIALGCLNLTTILCLFVSKDVSLALSLSAWLLAPLSVSVLYAARRLPFHHLVEAAEARGTAVLGEASAEDYGKVDAIAFEDVEAFRSDDVFVHQIKLYENGRLDELLYDLAGVFSVLGGPLDAVFRVATAELGMPSDVVLISTGREGLEASVEGVRISLGKWAHFRTEMISPYYDSEDTYREDSGEFSIMYVAIEGVIRAKVYLKYSMNEHFERNVRRLQRNGVRTLIRSYDPNIGDALLAASSHSTNLRVKVVRKKPEQLHDFAETRVDSGLVTSAGSRDLLYTLFMCQNYRKAVRILAYCKMIAVPLSILAALFLPLVSHTPFASVYGAAIGLFWLIPVHFISRFYFKKER